jgi:uncharacterized protein YjiS (DUF1127 family)
MASILARKNDTAMSSCARKRRGLAHVFQFVARANAVARQRRALLRLGDLALKDFGASRADAWHEGGRPWWDLPDCDARPR